MRIRRRRGSIHGADRDAVVKDAAVVDDGLPHWMAGMTASDICRKQGNDIVLAVLERQPQGGTYHPPRQPKGAPAVPPKKKHVAKTDEENTPPRAKPLPRSAKRQR